MEQWWCDSNTVLAMDYRAMAIGLGLGLGL